MFRIFYLIKTQRDKDTKQDTMASLPKVSQLSRDIMKEAMSNVVVCVTIPRRWRLRIWLASSLIKLGCWVAGMESSVAEGE